jgi:hypothetical protein
MQWLKRARSILNGSHGLSLPDPDRIDIGSVPDTASLIRAIGAAMPRTAILQVIGPRNPAVIAFLTSRSIARRRSTGEYFLSLEDGSTTELARLAASCSPDEVCAHLVVQDGQHTLLEAFGRDKGEDIVWLNRRLPRNNLRRLLQAVSRVSNQPPSSVSRSSDTGHLTKEGRHMVHNAGRALVMFAALALPGLTLVACVQRPPLVIETSSGDLIRLDTWTAYIASSGSVHGTATLVPDSYRETVATITITGAAPNAVHGWYAQLGECGRDLGILTGPHAYTPVVADQHGAGEARVTLPFTVPTSGRFFVTVREANTHHSPVIACGNLTKDPVNGGPLMAGSPRP